MLIGKPSLPNVRSSTANPPFGKRQQTASGKRSVPGPSRPCLHARPCRRLEPLPIRISRNLRAMNMRTNERRRAMTLHKAERISVAMPAFLSPRRTAMTNRTLGEPRWRVGHGVARAIKDLRRVRLSLVPRPDPGQRVLQKLCDEAERVSLARESKAPRASMP